MLRFAFLLPLLLNACWAKDETLAGFAAQGSHWKLTELGGTTTTMNSEISFPEAQTIHGLGPCNSFHAAITAPYPWFELGPIAATKKACPDLQQEQSLFTALASMTLAEVQGDTLILSDDQGREVVFRRKK